MTSLHAERVVRRIADKAVVDGVTLTLRPGRPSACSAPTAQVNQHC